MLQPFLIVVFSVVLNNNLNRFVNNNLLNPFYLSFHTIKTFERDPFLKKSSFRLVWRGAKLILHKGGHHSGRCPRVAYF
jgi:hypothetical protein